MEKITHIERRKNKVYVYFANPIGCPQPGRICEVYPSVEEAKKRKKELKKIGYI
mgnify:CR=1 FL=1